MHKHWAKYGHVQILCTSGGGFLKTSLYIFKLRRSERPAILSLGTVELCPKGELYINLKVKLPYVYVYMS